MCFKQNLPILNHEKFKILDSILRVHYLIAIVPDNITHIESIKVFINM